MFIKSISKILNSAYDSINDDTFNKVDPNLVRYFRIEYGKDWQIALQHHLYKKSIKDQKKAA